MLYGIAQRDAFIYWHGFFPKWKIFNGKTAPAMKLFVLDLVIWFYFYSEFWGGMLLISQT